MDSLKRSIVVALATFGASVVGMLLQHIVPAQVLTDSKGTVGAIVGLVTLLLALVLGLLVYTAFAVYTTQRDEAQGLGQVVIELDLALERYGPEAAPGRAGLRAALGAFARPLLRRRKARAAAVHLRGNPGDAAWARQLFRQPPALDRGAAAIADLRAGITRRNSPKRKC